MRASAIILSGLSAFAAAQTTDLEAIIQSEVSAGLASASAAYSSAYAAATSLIPDHSGWTPEQTSSFLAEVSKEASVNAAALDAATSAQNLQSSIIHLAESSLLAFQSEFSAEVASITRALATATGEAASSFSNELSLVTAAASSLNSLAGSVSPTASPTTGGVAPTNVPIIAAAAVGGFGLALIGLL